MKTCNKTPDMLPSPVRRGRPTTGKALSAADRKRSSRAALQAQLHQLLRMSDSDLLEYLISGNTASPELRAACYDRLLAICTEAKSLLPVNSKTDQNNSQADGATVLDSLISGKTASVDLRAACYDRLVSSGTEAKSFLPVNSKTDQNNAQAHRDSAKRPNPERGHA